VRTRKRKKMPDRRSSPKSPDTPVCFTDQPFLWEAAADGVLTSTDVTESGRLGSWMKRDDHPLLQQQHRTGATAATPGANTYDRFLDKTIKYHPAAPARPATPPPGPTLPPSRPPTPPKLKPITVPNMPHELHVGGYDPRLELLKRELAAAEVYISTLERLLGSERAKNNANEHVIVAFAKREIVNHKGRF
jgi:hypothetical protein